MGSAARRRGARAPGRSRLAWIATGVAIALAGALTVVVGIIATERVPPLTTLTVAAPAAGMTPTAEGKGGAAPSRVEPAALGLQGIGRSRDVPETPGVFLTPQRTTNRLTGSSRIEQAWWKVWWDPSLQTSDAVSLAVDANPDDAAGTATRIGRSMRTSALSLPPGDTGVLTSTGAPSGIPGARGGVWRYTEPSGATYDYRYVVFSRGPVTAIVSSTTYGGATSAPTFDRFARAQYAAMQFHTIGSAIGTAGLLAIFAGIAIALTAGRRRRTRGSGIGGDPTGLRGDPLRYWDGVEFPAAPPLPDVPAATTPTST